MKNFALLIVALILFGIVAPLGILWVFISAFRSRRKTKIPVYLSASCRQTALGIDILGNVVCADLLNAFFIGHGGYAFGIQGETISSGLGKNQQRQTLSWAGKALAGILDAIDENHCINAIQEF